MIQQIIIGLVFLAALFYLGRMVFRSFQAKKGCESNCKCETSSISLPKKSA